MIESLVLPAMGLFCVLFATFISFSLAFKWGFKALYMQVPFGLTAIVAGYVVSNVLLFVVPIFLGSFVGYTLRAGKSLQFFVLISALIVSLAYTGNFFYLKQVKGVDIMQAAKQTMIETFSTSDLTIEKKNEMLVSLDQVMEITEKIIPFTTFIYALFLSFLTFFIAKLLLSNVKDSLKIQGITLFRVNDYTIFVLIAGIAALLYFDSNVDMTIFIVGLNAVLITATLYFLQALGVIGFFLSKKGLPLYIMPVFFVLLLFTGIGVVLFITIMLAGLGALDLWADFRKIGDTQPKTTK